MPKEQPNKPGEAAVDDGALEDLFRSRYIEGSEWCRESHDEARTDFEMYGPGHHWNEKDREWAEKRQYPTLEMNQIWSVVNAPSSSEIVNRFEPKYLPRSPEDQDLADKTTQIARYVRQQAGAEFVDSGVFRDALICGMGAADWYFNEELGSEGLIQTSRIPIEDMIWDPAARKQNLEDARWVIRGVWMDVDEYKVLFPGADLPRASDGKNTGMYMWGRSGRPGRGDAETTRYLALSGTFYIPEKRTVLVFEMQDWITETEWRVVDPMTGETLVLSQEEYDELRQIRSDTGDGTPPGIPRRKRVYRRTFFGGTQLIAQEEIPTGGFTIKVLTCFEDQTEDGMRWFGIVRPLRDPQRVANRGFSQAVHILATNPKGVMLHEGDVFEDPRQAEVEWARANGRIEVTQGALQDGRIEIIEGKYPQDFERITQFCLNAVPRIAGIDPTFMGSAAGSGGDLRRVSGTALSQVLQQGQMMLAIPFDGLRKMRMAQGSLLMDYMRVFLPEETSIRIIGDTAGPSPEFLSFHREELDDAMFDIVVGEVPVSPTQQEESWRSLTDSGALKSLLDQQLLDGEDIADLAFGWPEDVRRRVREKAVAKRQMMEQMAAQGAPPEQAGGPEGGAPPAPMPVQ